MTAVEWLLEEFQEVHRDYGGLDTNWLKRFEQAKKMEKEQKDIEYLKGYNTGKKYNFLKPKPFESTVDEQVNEVGMEGHYNGCGCWMCNDLRGLSTIKSE